MAIALTSLSHGAGCGCKLPAAGYATVEGTQLHLAGLVGAADGRLVRDMYLFQVKSPSESRGGFDYYKLVATIPGDQAFRPLGEGGCKLVTN